MSTPSWAPTTDTDMSPTSGPPTLPPRGGGRLSLWQGFRCAMRGIGEAAATERSFRIELAAAVAAFGLGAALGLSRGEWALLSVVVALVLAAELFNTALEAVVDLVSPQYHPRARRAKDAAAGAVLMMALGAVAVGLALFLPRLLALGQAYWR